jgi:hypothetical protein
LADILKEQIWSFGNQVTFALENFNDAYHFSQQTQEYNPLKEKLAAKREDAQPILDTDRGQYLVMANWLQNLKWRQMVMRRYLDERTKEPFLSFIEKTREKPTGTLPAPLHELKQDLFSQYAVRVSDVLKDVSQRKLPLNEKEASEAERPTIATDAV